MIKFIIIVAYLAFVAISTIARPQFLAKNEFIDKVSTYEMLTILGVILTISMASIVNIHFGISKIVAKCYSDNIELGQAKATDSRNELNSSASFLMGAFLLAVVALVVKSETLNNIFCRSALNGFVLGTLLLMILVMYDLNRAIFKLAASDPVVRSYMAPPETKEGS